MELELKYKIKEDISDRLIRNGFVYQSEKHQIDEYFLVAEKLQGKNIYIRSRKNVLNNTYSFDFHEVISTVSTKETEISFNNEKDLEKIKYIFETLNYKSKCIIDKKRKLFKKDDIEVVIDYIKELGYFIEIEIQGDENEYNLKKLKDTANILMLKADNLITGIGYPELYLRETNKPNE